MKITAANVIVCSPGRNLVTLKIETDQGLSGIGDATLIRQHTTTPLAVGEIFNTVWDCMDLIQNQLIDYVRAIVVHAGGITHLRRIADLAALYQVRTGCHGATIDEALAAQYPCQRAYLPVNRLQHNGTLWNW